MSMVHIRFDARMIGHSGIGTYIRELLWTFTRCAPPPLTLLGAPASLTEFPWPVIPFHYPIYGVGEQWGYLKTLRHLDATLLHIPHYNVPFCPRTPLVVTIHDVIHLRFAPSVPAWLYARTMLTRACRKARRIITPSEHTKRDLLTAFQIPEEKIRVIPHGVPSFCSSPTAPTIPLPDLPDKFFLYVGLLKETKNVSRLLEAHHRFRTRLGRPIALVLAGRCPSNRLQREVQALEGVHWLGEVPRGLLPSLYQRAIAFVFPSLYEGFGFPPLEAMANGAPVIVSRVASLPEVVGDAGLYIEDPRDPVEIEAAMERMYQDDTLRQHLSQRGLERAKMFSWESAASQTLEVYQEALG